MIAAQTAARLNKAIPVEGDIDATLLDENEYSV